MHHEGRRDDLGGVQVLEPAVEAVAVLEVGLVEQMLMLHEQVDHGILLKHANIVGGQSLLQHLLRTSIEAVRQQLERWHIKAQRSLVACKIAATPCRTMAAC